METNFTAVPRAWISIGAEAARCHSPSREGRVKLYGWMILPSLVSCSQSKVRRIIVVTESNNEPATVELLELSRLSFRRPARVFSQPAAAL